MSVDSSELLIRLEEIVNQFGRGGSITMELVWKSSELPWSVKIISGECGYGTGNTLTEAIEDVLRDYDEHR